MLFLGPCIQIYLFLHPQLLAHPRSKPFRMENYARYFGGIRNNQTMTIQKTLKVPCKEMNNRGKAL